MKDGIIEPVEATEWLAPLVITHKSSGEIRLCVDLRKLNKAVIVDHFPLPNIEEILNSLQGASFFSTLDLTSAYYQVELDKISRDLTELE